MSWTERKRNAVKLLLDENIVEFNKALESGRIINPNVTNLKNSEKVKKYYSYLQNISNLKKRLNEI